MLGGYAMATVSRWMYGLAPTRSTSPALRVNDKRAGPGIGPYLTEPVDLSAAGPSPWKSATSAYSPLYG